MVDQPAGNWRRRAPDLDSTALNLGEHQMRIPSSIHATGRRRGHGFTLIELMIVVVIVAILAAVALPAYNDSVRKSRRTAAKTAVLDMASREEKFYTTNNAYASTASNLGEYAVPFIYSLEIGLYLSKLYKVR